MNLCEKVEFSPSIDVRVMSETHKSCENWSNLFSVTTTFHYSSVIFITLLYLSLLELIKWTRKFCAHFSAWESLESEAFTIHWTFSTCIRDFDVWLSSIFDLFCDNFSIYKLKVGKEERKWEKSTKKCQFFFIITSHISRISNLTCSLCSLTC